jgi:hypothetical protein
MVGPLVNHRSHMKSSARKPDNAQQRNHGKAVSFHALGISLRCQRMAHAVGRREPRVEIGAVAPQNAGIGSFQCKSKARKPKPSIQADASKSEN